MSYVGGQLLADALGAQMPSCTQACSCMQVPYSLGWSQELD